MTGCALEKAMALDLYLNCYLWNCGSPKVLPSFSEVISSSQCDNRSLLKRKKEEREKETKRQSIPIHSIPRKQDQSAVIQGQVWKAGPAWEERKQDMQESGRRCVEKEMGKLPKCKNVKRREEKIIPVTLVTREWERLCWEKMKKKKKILQVTNHWNPDAITRFFQCLASLYLSSRGKIAIKMVSPSSMAAYYPVTMAWTYEGRGREIQARFTHIPTYIEEQHLRIMRTLWGGWALRNAYRIEKNKSKERPREGDREWCEWKAPYYEGENGHAVRVKWSLKFRKQVEKRAKDSKFKNVQNNILIQNGRKEKNYVVHTHL